MKNINISKKNNINVGIEPFSKEEIKQIRKDIYDESTGLLANNFLLFLNNLTNVVSNYRKELNKGIIDFNRRNKYHKAQMELLKSIPDYEDNEQWKKFNAYSIKVHQQHFMYDKKFIKILEKGNIIINEIRNLITQQDMPTYFYIQDKNGKIIKKEKEDVKGLKLVLSTYGSTENNPYNLAYQINTDIRENIKSINEEEEQNLNAIISLINSQKPEYLKTYFPDKNYKPVFNSKDAEILLLLSFYPQYQKSLDLNFYAYLRANTGGGGGYRTAASQGGDIGNISVKYFSKSTNIVNFQRQQNLQINFERLEKVLLSKNLKEIQKTFLSIFTENENNILKEDELAQFFNKNAIETINSLFKDLIT